PPASAAAASITAAFVLRWPLCRVNPLAGLSIVSSLRPAISATLFYVGRQSGGSMRQPDDTIVLRDAGRKGEEKEISGPAVRRMQEVFTTKARRPQSKELARCACPLLRDLRAFVVIFCGASRGR